MNKNISKSRLGIFMLAIVFGLPAFSSSQENNGALLSYQRNFVRSNLGTKSAILQQAAADADLVPSLGAFYEFSLSFALQNADILRDDPDLIAMASFASRELGKINQMQSVQTLWRGFMAFRDNNTRIAVLQSLGALGKGDSRVIENLNQFVSNQNNLFRSGMLPEYATLSACIETLGILGDGSSFPALFSAMIIGYPEQISKKAASALVLLRGDYKKFLMDVIKKNPPIEKSAAFKAGLGNAGFAAADLGELAESALDVTLGLFPADGDEQRIVQELRYSSVVILTSLKWTRATTLGIKHFYRVQTDYDKGLAPKERFLEAISCLGAMGSSEASQALSLQLGLLNSKMERSREFDADILASVIDALGDIGDKVAFDYLLYIGYLPYPDAVQSAARDAMNRLKW